tara:strand:- start:1363 stop:1548 length:186 start_codon:yes stop_codon:yes gene_type:complete
MKKVSTISILAATMMSCNPMTSVESNDAGVAADAGEKTSYVFEAENIVIASKNKSLQYRKN